MKYTLVLTREAVLKALSTTQKLTIWWPNSATDAAEQNVLYMSSTVYRYKYGTVTLAPNADQDAVLAAAADPSGSYNFVWNTDDPKKMISQSDLPPITSSKWNPDPGASTNTDDVLNLTFYKEVNVASTTALVTSGSTVAVGVIFWPDSTVANDKWVKEGNIEWVADTSTPSGNNNNNQNKDSAMMLTQGLAAGAALLAAFSF